MNALCRQYAFAMIQSRLTGADQATHAAAVNAATALCLTEQQFANDVALLDELAAALRNGDADAEERIMHTERWIQLRDDAQQPCEPTYGAEHAMGGT